MNKTIAISGGFDPVHIGHLNMIKGAAQEGSVIVILNSDAWLQQKKGYVFMPFEERKAILEAFSDVHHVVEVDDSDGTVCAALDQLRPCYFGNGGDRVSDNVPEVKLVPEAMLNSISNPSPLSLLIPAPAVSAGKLSTLNSQVSVASTV